MCQAYDGEHAYMTFMEQFENICKDEKKAAADAAKGDYDNPMAWALPTSYQPWQARWLAYHRAWLRATA